MDFPSHMLWALFLARVLGISNWTLFAFFAVFPDLAFSTPLLVAWAGKSFRGSFRSRREIRNLVAGRFGWIKKVYRVAHSFVTAALFGLFGWLVYGQVMLPALAGWLLHCVFDLFVHKGGVVEAEPLYPLRYRVNGFIHWSDRRFLLLNYCLLAIAYAWLLFWR
ncbi:MAG: hypothetical protein NTY90_05205 [Candidatus Micrarchaeota archaeon]|nr:hypothetical protein [Candidatus Micrarchaeota archaeon]